MTSVAIWVALAGFGGWLVGIPFYRLLSCIGLLDRPNARSSHSTPTVRGGGLGIMIVVLALGGAAGLHPPSVWSVAWLFLLFALAIVSFVDDLRSLPWFVRFGTHGLSAAGFLVALIQCGRFDGVPAAQAILLGGLLFLFLIGYANAFNFMDGVNGIAASQAAVTSIGTIAVAHVAGASFSNPALVLAAIVAGAAAGFLPHNFPRARMFMGDVGSVSLGFGLAAIAIWIAADHGWWLLVPLACLHANFVLDTAITVVRRMLRGELLHEAHREHFYQRLVRAGWSHTRVTLTEMALQLVVAMTLTLAVSLGKPAVFGVAFAVVLLWVGFFIFCERVFRAAQLQVEQKVRLVP
jgi:UDP-N-acetylmuramyl pentapeptide phosphotransferase/UDP-N-acetylglucosamine-1-phosphate transferase